MEKSKNRTERKKEEMKKKIMGIAMKLFNNQGFDNTTVEQIAEEADVAKGTVFNHFSGKEAIINEYIKSTISEEWPKMIGTLKEMPDVKSRLRAVLRKSLEWMQIEINKELYEKYFSYKMQKSVKALKEKDSSMSSGLRIAIEYVLVLGRESGEVRKDIDVHFLAAQLEIFHITLLIFWVTNPEVSNIDESIEKNVEIFLNGAKA